MEVRLRDPSIWPDRGEIVNNSLHAGTRTTTPLITSCMEGSHLTLTQHYQGRARRGWGYQTPAPPSPQTEWLVVHSAGLVPGWLIGTLRENDLCPPWWTHLSAADIPLLKDTIPRTQNNQRIPEVSSLSGILQIVICKVLDFKETGWGKPRFSLFDLFSQRHSDTAPARTDFRSPWLDDYRVGVQYNSIIV